MSEKELEPCCQFCAGHGVIVDYTGDKMLMKKPCETCFTTGFPPWLIQSILWNGPYPPRGGNNTVVIKADPDMLRGAVEEAVKNMQHGDAAFKAAWEGRNDGPDRNAAAGTHGDTHGREQGPLPTERRGTGSGDGGGGDAQRGTPGDEGGGDGGGPRPGDPLPPDVQQRIVDTMRSINQLWAENPK